MIITPTIVTKKDIAVESIAYNNITPNPLKSPTTAISITSKNCRPLYEHILHHKTPNYQGLCYNIPNEKA